MSGLAYEDLTEQEKTLLAEIQSQPLRAVEHLRELETLHAQQLQTLLLAIAQFEEDRRLDRARRFGASAEAGDQQYRLFDEADTHGADAELDDAADEDVIEVAAHSKRRPKRRPLPQNLPRVVIQHDLDDPHCGCGAKMRVIGEKVSEQLDVIPARVYVIEHHRPTYSCSLCDESIVTAPMPPQAIPKSVASPGLLAHVAVAKYADGLPLYRQSKQFERLGIDLPRNTLAGHMVKLGELLQPLTDALCDHIAQGDVVGMDETPVQVLKEPGKPAQSQSYMWVMKGGPPHQPAIVYNYDTSRAQTVPDELLRNYAGYLQTDGYGGYNRVLARKGVIGVGCWAHARRKFKDAEKALPKKQQSSGNRVRQAMAYIGKLYALEKALRDVPAESRRQRRQAEAAPILERFKAWLDKQSVPPQTLLGKAVGYTLTQWPRLVVYVNDGRLSIDNNAVENAIRPFAVGRRNWLFSDSQSGARASARLYSLIESAKANGLNDYGYLKYVLSELPKVASDDAVAALLPWRVDRSRIEAQLVMPDQHVVR